MASDSISSTRFAELERALLEHPAVHEAAVLCRGDLQGGERTIAYVVPADLDGISALQPDLRGRLAGGLLPDGYVFMSTLPRDAYGNVDRGDLEQYEVIDDDVVERWTQALRSVEGIGEVRVMAVQTSQKVGSLHRSELIPGRPGGAPQSLPAARRESARAASSRPARAHGGPLVEGAGEPKTLADALVHAARWHGGNGIVYFRADGTRVKQSYRQLLADAGQLLAGLAGLGLKPADKVIFQLADGREFLTAYWACLLGGMVPVPFSIAPSYVASNATVQKLSNAWQLLDRPLILASDALASEVQSALDLSHAATRRVQSIVRLPKARAVPRHESRPDDLALLLFTSGSTGTPKGVMQSHRSLLCMARGTAQQNHFASRDVTLNWMPLEHVGAISFLHTMPATLGCEQIHVPTEYILQDPLRWLDLIDQLNVTITWGPNFAFKLMNERADDIRHRSWDLSSMRFLVSAGELIVSNTTRRFLGLVAPHKLSATALRPAFGMSETCSGITWSDGYKKDANDADKPFVELGFPIPSASLRIVDDRDQLLTEGEIGRLQLKGPSVTTGYYKNPEANKKAFTKDGWFDTGDLGFVYGNRLTLTGRKKDEIVINGINYVAAEIEAVVDTVDGVQVSYSAACAVRPPGSDTDELAIFFSPSSGTDHEVSQTLRSIRERVATDRGINPTYLVPLAREHIPKTAIGKIQRSELRKRFEDGEFDAMLRRADLLTDINAIPAWFYRKVWRSKAPSSRLAFTDLGPTLVFLDEIGLGDALLSELRRIGQQCIAVEAGLDFVRLDRNRYRVDPKNRDHYRLLMQALREDALHIAQIVHLWAFGENAATVSAMEELVQAQHQGLYSVLFLVQAIARLHEGPRSLKLHVVTRGAQVTSSADECSCVHSTVVGLLKTIPRELSWLRCRHIDLERGTPATNAAQVLDELRTPASDDEVAYRGGRRLVWRLSSVDLRGQEPQQPPIRPGGIYLVTGGLGGIGAHLAAVLMRDYRAKLILVGTTSLPKRSEWSTCVERGDRLADRIRRYLEIESLGGELVYESADVSDLARLNDIVVAAEARWSDELAGIFHLAAGGDVSSHWQEGQRHHVSRATPESFDLMFRSKVYGTWAIHQIVKKRANAIMVSFGSVLGIFGAARFGAYAAADTFLRNFALDQSYRQHPRSYSFSWTVWHEMGLSRGEPVFAKDLYRALGYFVIPKELGVDSLMGGLWRGVPDLIVGLDAGNMNIRKHLETDVHPLQGLVAYFDTQNGAAPAQPELAALGVQDGFGVKSQCEFRHLAAMPLTGDGRIDGEALRALNREKGPVADRNGEQPRTEVEKQIAGILRDVLGGRQPGVGESFFRLGGNSLSATRAISRMGELFRVRLEVRDMFEHGTVHGLASLVAQRQSERQPDVDSDAVETTDAEARLMQVDRMSDDQVAELLGRMQREKETHERRTRQ